jgi:nitrite reductase/ring-hydroxylating ferredoxin subunit
MRRISLLVIFLSIAFYSRAQNDEPIPLVSFSEIIINLSFPQFRALTADGGFVEVDGGVRGIIIYREDAEHFIAYERNCTYEANESCARVDTDISRLFLIDHCCGSRFGFSDGYPTKGPASRPLRKYRISQTGNTLTVTDEIVF